MNLKNKRPIRSRLYIKNNRYYAVFFYRGKDGKDKALWRALGLEAKPGNKRLAQDKMEEMKNKFCGILDVPGYEIAFVDYLRYWTSKREGEMEVNSFCSLKNEVTRKIIPFFEPKKLALSEVKPMHINDFYTYLFKYGRRDGTGGLSISTIKKIKSTLNSAFKSAIIEGLIEFNPLESVRLPANDNPRKFRQVLSLEEANHLLGCVMDDPLMYPILLITLRYGLRKSEVLGLKWSAIDFAQNQLRIESTIVAGKQKERNKTKTPGSNKSFPLFEDVKEALMVRKKHQTIEGTSPDYVFTKPGGHYIPPSWPTKRLHEILDECGLPCMRFHDLRHSTSTILHDNGMDIKEVQQWMRHDKIEMTADVYTHISKKRERQMAESLVDMLPHPCPQESQMYYKIKEASGE